MLDGELAHLVRGVTPSAVKLACLQRLTSA